MAAGTNCLLSLFMKRIIQSIINFFVALFGGKSIDKDYAFKTYTIDQGEHFCNERTFKPVKVDHFRFQFRFDETCVYDLGNEVEQWDINKLYGFTDGTTDQHENSARFGWNWRDGQLRLFAYVYANGVRHEKELCAHALYNDVREAQIIVRPDQYIFVVCDETHAMPRGPKTRMAEGVLLYPYFGGTQPAPHDIRIFIKNL